MKQRWSFLLALMLLISTLMVFTGCEPKEVYKVDTTSSLTSLPNSQTYREVSPSPYLLSLPASARPSDIITFGSYEQDDNIRNGKEPIKWIILDIEPDGTLVLISRYALDCKPYNTTRTTVTWETCTLRNWLNDVFYNAAFSDEEKALILTTNVENEDKLSGTEVVKNTQDKVYLLSVNEAANYFSDEKVYPYFTVEQMRICYPTRYASKLVFTPKEYGGTCTWWLRSPSDVSEGAKAVWFTGTWGGDWYVDASDFAVRPVVRLAVQSENVSQ